MLASLTSAQVFALASWAFAVAGCVVTIVALAAARRRGPQGPTTPRSQPLSRVSRDWIDGHGAGRCRSFYPVVIRRQSTDVYYRSTVQSARCT